MSSECSRDVTRLCCDCLPLVSLGMELASASLLSHLLEPGSLRIWGGGACGC